jgi:hypothetical protein
MDIQAKLKETDQPLLFKQDVPTRWNATIDMIRRVISIGSEVLGQWVYEVNHHATASNSGQGSECHITM